MAGGHRDRAYARWWIRRTVVFAVAVAIIFVLPFLSSSSQPEQQLQKPLLPNNAIRFNRESVRTSHGEQSPLRKDGVADIRLQQ